MSNHVAKYSYETSTLARNPQNHLRYSLHYSSSTDFADITHPVHTCAKRKSTGNSYKRSYDITAATPIRIQLPSASFLLAFVHSLSDTRFFPPITSSHASCTSHPSSASNLLLYRHNLRPFWHTVQYPSQSHMYSMDHRPNHLHASCSLFNSFQSYSRSFHGSQRSSRISFSSKTSNSHQESALIILSIALFDNLLSVFHSNKGKKASGCVFCQQSSNDSDSLSQNPPPQQESLDEADKRRARIEFALLSKYFYKFFSFDRPKLQNIPKSNQSKSLSSTAKVSASVEKTSSGIARTIEIQVDTDDNLPDPLRGNSNYTEDQRKYIVSEFKVGYYDDPVIIDLTTRSAPKSAPPAVYSNIQSHPSSPTTTGKYFINEKANTIDDEANQLTAAIRSDEERLEQKRHQHIRMERLEAAFIQKVSEDVLGTQKLWNKVSRIQRDNFQQKLEQLEHRRRLQKQARKKNKSIANLSQVSQRIKDSTLGQWLREKAAQKTDSELIGWSLIALLFIYIIVRYLIIRFIVFFFNFSFSFFAIFMLSAGLFVGFVLLGF